MWIAASVILNGSVKLGKGQSVSVPLGRDVAPDVPLVREVARTLQRRMVRRRLVHVARDIPGRRRAGHAGDIAPLAAFHPFRRPARGQKWQECRECISVLVPLRSSLGKWPNQGLKMKFFD